MNRFGAAWAGPSDDEPGWTQARADLAEIDGLAVEIGCLNHGPDYGACVDCSQAAERVLDSEWLARRDRRAMMLGWRAGWEAHGSYVQATM